MPGSLTELPRFEIEDHKPSVAGGSTHPMRTMTRRAAGLEGEPWDDDARATVGAYFDELAPDWHTRTSPQRDAVITDALNRGVGDRAGDLCLEVGSGIGAYTPQLAPRWRRVVATELAIEMLRRAPADVGHRVLADGAQLPFGDGRADAVVLVNCFLFPDEVARVLAPDGLVLWVNSSGAETPIHLPPEDVIEALPGRWEGVRSTAGIGIWCALRRAS
jgi:SAM-dependent methyltransferase